MVFYTEIYLPATLKPWHFKWYLPFCVRRAPQIRNWQAPLMGIQCSMKWEPCYGWGNLVSAEDKGGISEKYILSSYLEALPPTVPVLSQARSSGGRLSKWVPPPRLLLSHHGKLQQANTATLQLVRPSPSEHRCWPPRFENKWKSMLASDSHGRKNCDDHMDPSCHPMMESLLRWLHCHVLP